MGIHKCNLCGTRSDKAAELHRNGYTCPNCEAPGAMVLSDDPPPYALLPRLCPDEVLAGFSGAYEPDVVASIYAKIIRLAEIKS